MANKISLHVGLNKYALPTMPRLSGCVNDALAMQRVYEARKFYTTVLTDEAATLKAVTDWAANAARRAINGEIDAVAITWAGHGTQIPDTSGDERDKLDEALVAYNVAPASGYTHWKNVWADDDIRAWVKSIPISVSVEAVFDTCFSGGLNRAAPGANGASRTRFVPGIGISPTAREFASEARRQRKGLSPLKAATRKISRPMWSACQEGQTSADAFIDENWHGAFTWAFTKAMSEGEYAPGRVLARTRHLIKRNGFDQVPMLEEF